VNAPVKAALAFALAACCTAAFACGHCVEDKVAAVYDHAELMRAEAARHHVAYCAIDGKLEYLQSGDVAQRGLVQAAEATPGVDRGSIRISVDNAALSFSFDPSKVSVDKAVRTMNKKIAAQGLRLDPMRVMERTAVLKNVEAASPTRRP
jgi:hypothetical protein